MGMVIAKESVYLAPQYGGFKAKGEKFNYEGPDNEFLEAVEIGPYETYSIQELKDELTRRGMGIPPNATQATMSELLVGDDASNQNRNLEPKDVVPARKGRKAKADEPEPVFDPVQEPEPEPDPAPVEEEPIQ